MVGVTGREERGVEGQVGAAAARQLAELLGVPWAAQAAFGPFSAVYVSAELTLDFDEWFDRGTPTEDKATVRSWLLEGPSPRGFAPTALPSGHVRVDCERSIVRGPGFGGRW